MLFREVENKNAKLLEFTRVILQCEMWYSMVVASCQCFVLQDAKTHTATKVMDAYNNIPNSLQGKTDELFDHKPQTPTAMMQQTKMNLLFANHFTFLGVQTF